MYAKFNIFFLLKVDIDINIDCRSNFSWKEERHSEVNPMQGLTNIRPGCPGQAKKIAGQVFHFSKRSAGH